MRLKSLYHLKPIHKCMNHTAMFVWRVTAFLIMLTLTTMMWVNESRYNNFPDLKYLTIWGIYMTLISFGMIVVAHIKHLCASERVKQSLVSQS